MMSRRSPTFTATTFFVWSALLIWVAGFLLVYVGIALACERGFADVEVAGIPFIPLLAAFAFAVTLALTIVVIRAARRRQRTASERTARFVGFVASVLGLLALAAIGWSALPPLLLFTGCA
jgi:hypothetical protein